MKDRNESGRYWGRDEYDQNALNEMIWRTSQKTSKILQK